MTYQIVFDGNKLQEKKAPSATAVTIRQSNGFIKEYFMIKTLKCVDQYFIYIFDFQNSWAIQMSQEPQVLDNESNLLQSTSDLNQELATQKPTSSNAHDDMPIGGGKKFDFSQFPAEGQVPKKVVKKPPARFAKKTEETQADKSMQQSTAKQLEQTPSKGVALNPDDIPIGGGSKNQMSEFPDENEQPKKPVKKPPARFAERMKKNENKQQNAGQAANDPPKNIDETPIGGNKSNNFDEQPIGGGNKSSFDQQPIGGGKKMEFSEYPDENAPKPVPKKTTKKATKAPVKAEVPIDAPNIDEMPIGGGNKVPQLDEMPIGKSSNNAMFSQFPQGDEQPVVETNYTMSQKLKSKAVKLKLSGMEDLLELLQNNHNSQQLYEIQIGKLLKETNPACLQKILQCLKVWVQKEKKWGDDEAKSCIQNGYINGKPNTKKLSVEIVDQMYEKSPEVVQMALLVGLKGKVPKNLAGYIAFLNELLSIYGMKRMKFLKPYFPDIVVILNRQKLVAVKTQGINILKQAYKWLSKQVVQPLIKDLKENLRKELDTFWQGHDKAQVMAAPKDIPEANDGKPKKKVDAYQLSQAVDIFKKYNQKFSEQVIAQEKWSEKVRMMQELFNAASVPKLAHNSDFRHITQMIRRLINHSNFNVVLWDLKIMAVLSKGLRRHFAPTVKSQFANVISKFRDKKTQMIDETFNTLNQFNYCISIEDVIDDVKEGIVDKAPNMRVNLINWIGKFVEKKVQEKDEVPDKAKDALKSLFPIFEKLLADGVAEVRDTMVKNIGKMKILMGDQFFALMDKKMTKGQAGKIDQVKKQMPKKVSKQKDKKQTQGPAAKPSKQTGTKASSKNIENSSIVSNQGKGDISDEISDLMPKMTHSDWQKRKETAEALISLIGNSMDSKINSTVLFDFLGVLKTRIADPNKNNIKYFVQLTSLVFEMMNDRDVKANGKNFICALADGLSDKVQANKKEIALALNKIGGIYGREQLLTILGSYLDTDKESRIEIINIILQNSACLEKADTKEFPKGIIRGLTDKNKQIRNLAEKLLQIIQQKVGIEVFKNLAKNQRPAIAKDLATLLSKYQNNTKNNSSTVTTMSKVTSSQLRVPPQAPVSAKKQSNPRSESKNSKANQQSFDPTDTYTEEIIPDNRSRQFYATTQPVGFRQAGQSFVESGEQFAPLKFLSAERIQRQERQQRYPWMCDALPETQEQQLRESIEKLFNQDLAKKMFSTSYERVIQAATQIIKLAKDISYQNHIRQVYDLILKWVFVRLWGGSPSVNAILEVLPNIMSVLEKKKLAINDNQVDIIAAILRQSFLTGYMNDHKVSESLYLITKLLIVLSSGDRLLKKFLRQYSVELPTIHRHVRKQATEFYRVGLSKLIKNQLMDYVGNGNSLQQASRIKQLKNDQEFIKLLYNRFHENVLDSFGFRNNQPPSSNYQSQPSPIQNKSPVPQRKAEQIIPVSIQQRQQFPATQPTQHVSHPISQPVMQSQQQIPAKRTPTQSIQGRSTLSRQEDSTRQTLRGQQFQRAHTTNPKQDYDQQFDLSLYNMPPQGNPLGRHLTKLLSPNDIPESVIAFFNNMFVESGERISAELTANANIIFGVILKSVKHVIENRGEINPQKIVIQVNLLQQAIKCKYIINNINNQLLYHGTKFALFQLVHEDQNKNLIAQDLAARRIDFKPDQFVKAINGVMLRILENACAQEIVNILLNLLNAQIKMSVVSQKTISLIIKCLSRVAASYSVYITPERTKQFFQRAVEYLSIANVQISLQTFEPRPDQRLSTEENVLKTMKAIVSELITHFGQDIWVHYENAMSQSRYSDNLISQFIQSKNVPYPDNIQQANQEDEHLKKINDLLSKTKTFQMGVTEMKRYMEANPHFVPVEYFTSRGYEQRFIIMVMNSLEASRMRKTPTKRQIRQQRSQNSRTPVEQAPNAQATIQDRIKRLRMQFDQGPQKQEDKPVVNLPATTTATRVRDEGEDRALEIKRRIDEMRNRLARN